MFNDRLRATRIDRGKTQQEMADYLSMALRSYQQYEQGKSEPPLDKLAAMADFLDIPTDYLLGRDSYLKQLGVSFDSPKTNPPRRPKSKQNRS